MVFWAGKKVTVAGGVGFLGSSLVLKLVELDADVLVVDSLDLEYGANLFNLRPVEGEFELVVGDLASHEIANHAVNDRDFIFSLAGQTAHLSSMKNPAKDLKNNVEAHLSLIKAWGETGTKPRVVFTSTRQVYGRPTSIPVTERHSVNPVDVNGINKVAAEMHYLLDTSHGNSSTTVMRLTNCFGPRMRVRDSQQTFLGGWVGNLLRNETVPIFGDGSQLRDFIFADDFVSAILAVAEAENTVGEILNVGGSRSFSLTEVAHILSSCSDQARFEYVPFPAGLKKIDIGSFATDSTKIFDLVGWQPSVEFETGIAETLRYFRAHGENYGI